MKSTKRVVLWLAVLLLATGQASRLAAQEPDLVAKVRPATAALAEADKQVVAARNALQAARDNLDTNRFNSAAYNARVTTDQENSAKDKHEKADAGAKQDALELYELAQEMATQAKAALEAAQKLLPQREAEAAAAESKYAQALAAAEQVTEPLRLLVRQSESEAATKVKEAKLALEKAAFAKAAAEQQAAANASYAKTAAALAAADAALQQAGGALKQASDADRPAKTAEAEKAVKAYAAARQAALQNLPDFRGDGKPLNLDACLGVLETDKVLQAATAAQQAAQQELQSKVEAVKQAEGRVKAAQEGVEKRIAKVRATKDLAREQEAAKRAEAARVAAEQLVPPKKAEVEKSQQAHTAALQAAVQTLVLAADGGAAVAAEKEALAKALAAREAALKTQHEGLVKATADAQAAADQAQKDVATAEKLLGDRAAVRVELLKIRRQRYYRELGAAQNELRQHEAALAKANQDLQPKLAALNKAAADHKQASDNAAAAQKAAADAAAALAAATKEKEAADKVVQEKGAAKGAADQAAKDAATALAAAQEALTKAPAEAKAAAEKTVQEKDGLAKAAAQQATQADAAVKSAEAARDKVAAALAAAQPKADQSAKAAKDAAQKVTDAQAALDKATAEKTAAEQLIGQERQIVEAAPVKIAEAKAAAYGGLKPLPASAWDYSKARHLLVRAGFGGTPDEVSQLQAKGLHGAVRHLVNFKTLPPADVPFAATPKWRPEQYERALSGEDQQRLREQRVAADRQQLQGMRVWWLRRMIESPRPLEEKLTLFWHGQIPSQYSDVGDSYHMYLQNQLFREHAAGNFSALLYGIAHDAAMLKYLNNDVNVKGRANENLAREIMELFSMGRDQGYSEIDIRQGARALTGFTYDSWSGQFRFVSASHDTDAKTIFGKSGNWSGDDFVRLILETPAPARFVARQMFAFFAHDDPSVDTVEALANVVRANDYELAPMLENLFLSEEFYSAAAMHTDVKSPVQLLVGLHRDLGIKSADYEYLARALRELGQDLFDPPSVFGWQAGRSWITTSRVLNRYNVLAEILGKRHGKISVDVVGTVLSGKTFQNHGEVVDFLVKSCWSVPLPQTKRAALVEFLKPLPEPAKWGNQPDPVNARLTRLLILLMCSPEAQMS